MERKIAPVRYVRQEGIARMAGGYCAGLGRRPLVAGGETALSVCVDSIVASLDEVGMATAGVHWYGGQCSLANIEKLADICRQKGADFLIGVGGGKALDTVKAAAFRLGVPVVTVPTIAATCAAWTPLSVTYTDSGVFIELSPLAQTPSAVLADTGIIARAPVRLLGAGIGDTLAKWFELEVTSRKAGESAVIRIARETAWLCYQVLLEHGEAAIQSATRGEISFDLEQVTDAVIMLSGMVSGLGGDDCRTAAAHAIYSGLTHLPVVHESCYHGETVAFGILAQLVMDGREKESLELAGRIHPMGLPVTLGELGVKDPSREELTTMARGAVETEDMKNMPFPVTPEMVIDAVLGADRVGRVCTERK